MTKLQHFVLVTYKAMLGAVGGFVISVWQGTGKPSTMLLGAAVHVVIHLIERYGRTLSAEAVKVEKEVEKAA